MFFFYMFIFFIIMIIIAIIIREKKQGRRWCDGFEGEKKSLNLSIVFKVLDDNKTNKTNQNRQEKVRLLGLGDGSRGRCIVGSNPLFNL
jgi:hypothetical protein